MLSKEQLLENYEKLRTYWLENAPNELFGASQVAFMKQWKIDIEEALVEKSERYWAIKQIGYILYNYKDYENRINKFVSKLANNWEKIWLRSFARIDKEACHWKREGYESKEAYRDYLNDDVSYPYGWNSSNAYDASVIENQLGDISKITDEPYDLCL